MTEQIRLVFWNGDRRYIVLRGDLGPAVKLRHLFLLRIYPELVEPICICVYVDYVHVCV